MLKIKATIMRFIHRFSRVLLRLLVVLAGAAILSLTVLAVFLHRNPQALAQRISVEIQQRLGVACSMESVAVALLPVPSLALSDVRISGKRVDFSVAYATLRPAIMPLLRGEFEPGSVTLLRPQAVLRAGADASSASVGGSEQAAGASASGFFDVFASMKGCAVDVLYGSLAAESADGSPLRLDDVAGEFSFSPPLHVRIGMSGVLRNGGRPLPFNVSGSGVREADGGVRIAKARLALDQDRFALDGVLSFSKENMPSLEGSLDIQRLSLSQWFGFARRMPPGLQGALSDVRGGIDFRMDMRGLEASRIEAEARDGRFTGQGGVPDWSQPVVVLDLAASDLNLGAAFPELEGGRPPAPDFGHPPLTPEPGSPGAESMPGPGIGYDVSLRVGVLRVWKLSLGDAAFRCAPGEKEQVAMSFEAGRIYGGRGEGSLLLRPTAPVPEYSVKAGLKNVSVERLAEALGAPGPAGKLWLDAAFSGRGEDMAAFLTSLDGRTSVRLENGFFPNGKLRDEKRAFTRLSLEGRAKSASPAARGSVPTELAYNGQWKAVLEAPRIRGSFQAEGLLSVAGSAVLPLQLRNAPGELSLWLPKEATGFSEDFDAQASGRFSLHSGRLAAEIENMQAALWGAILRGNVRAALTSRGSEGKAALSVVASDARRALRAARSSTAAFFPPGTLGQAQGQADMSWSDARIDLANLRLALDGTIYRGSFTGQWKERPQWSFDLAADSLDLDQYIPPRTPAGPTSPPAGLWSLQWLRDNDVQGALRVDELRLRKLKARQLRLPLRLKDGVLECAGGQGSLYGGPLTLKLRADAAKGLDVQSTLSADDVDLLPLSADWGFKAALGGRGSFTARLHGVFFSGADMPAALSGPWSLRITDAYLQSRDAKEQPVGPRTVLGVAHVSGNMDKGVLHGYNLRITGEDVRAEGGGWINLNTRELDVSMHASMRGVPDFPVRFHGSLDDPRRSVNAGKAILNALGKLGAGVADVLGGVVGGVVGGALRLLP